VTVNGIRADWFDRATEEQFAMSVPCASVTTGVAAREEIKKVLRRFGCEEIGLLDNFTHRSRQVQLRASAKGWAQRYLRGNPWTCQRRSSGLGAGRAQAGRRQQNPA
jgi:hypothetical protein